MIRHRALQVALVVVGLLFLAGLYPLLMMQAGPAEQMLGGVYITLGLFLLLAVRKPSAHRSLIAFTAWSSLVHGAIMAVQAYQNVIPRVDLLRAVLPLGIIGVVFIALAPARDDRDAVRTISRLREATPSVGGAEARDATMNFKHSA
jgi:hypothetical protein